MAVTSKKTVKGAEKLSISRRLGCIMISVVTIRKNVKGTRYIPTPFGAVYARIDEVKPGLQCVVELKKGDDTLLAINTPTPEDVMGFLNEKLGEYPNLTMSDIKEMYGL